MDRYHLAVELVKYDLETDVAVLKINDKSVDLRPINIGNPQERTVEDVAIYVKKVLNSKSPITYCKEMSDDPQKRRPNINLLFIFIKCIY